MNVGTCWGKNTIGPRGRSVEKAPGSNFNFNFMPPIHSKSGSSMERWQCVKLLSLLCEAEESKVLVHEQYKK
jgi:hypothetical protein